MNERDRNMMNNPSNWPNWPTLPLKNNRDRKPGEFPRLAVLFDTAAANQTPALVFVEGSMYEITDAQIKAAPKADTDQLLADGWVVD